MYSLAIPAVILLHFGVYLSDSGLRYSFFRRACPVVFFELAWAVEIGAAESPTENVISLPMSSVGCITVLSESSRECVLLWYPKSQGFLVLGSVMAVVGVLPSLTPTPCSQEQ